MTSHRHKTCKRYDVPGDSHFVTFSCFRRLPLLGKNRTRQWLLEAIALARAKGQFHLWAYVIMPEHVHLVILPHETRISAIFTTIKQSTAKTALNWLKEHSPDFMPALANFQEGRTTVYRFWQRSGGYDRNLRSTRDIHEKIRYVHENPVRRGLVAHPDEWAWSSARAWATGEDEPLPIYRDSVPRLTALDTAIDSSMFG